MEPKGSRAVVGLFVLVLTVAAIVALLWLVGIGGGSTKTFRVLMKESVSGLSQDAPVKYRGVDVGRVSLIRLRADDPEQVWLTLEIDPLTPVREDTRAQLEFQGITGLAFINLVGGSRESPTLRRKAGEQFPVIDTSPSIFARLDTQVTALIASVSATSTRLEGVLGAVDSASVARSLHNLEQVTEALASHSGEIESGTRDAARFLSNAADASENLPGLVAKFDTLATEWSRASVEVRGLAVQGRSEVTRAATQLTGETQSLVADLRRLVARLDRVVEELEADPSVVLRGRGADQLGPGE